MTRLNTSRGIRKVIASLFLVLFAAAPRMAWAQGEASINGAVTDTTGAIIAGATVKVKNVEIGTVRAIVTDNVGRYDAPSLAVGKYEVSAEQAGFRTEVKTGITLAIGQRAQVNLMLAVGGVQQSISVEETAMQLAVTTADFSGLVGEQQVKDLPLNGRSYDQLLTLNPGVVNYTSQRAGGIGTSNSVVGNMFSASGRRPQENLYILNGVEFTSASEVNNTPGGTSGQLLGVDAVREFSVVTDAYGAEYGKRPGAQINIVTASGTNQLHGDAYEFLRNSALDARNFFDLPQIPHFERNVFGGSLGGPIKKDKTFLFANYEGFRQALGLSDVTLVPDANARAGILPCAALTTVTTSCNASTPPTTVVLGKGVANLLNLWPVANGPELTINGLNSGIAESLSSPQQHIREDFGTARFDQVFSDKDTFAGVYTVDDSQSFSPTTNPFSTVDIFLREQVASLSETHVFSPSILNKATFGFSRGAFYFNSGVTGTASSVAGGWVNTTGVNVPGAVVIGGGTTLNGASALTNGGTNAGSNLTAVRNLFTWADQVSITHGKHLLSFGVWFERLQANDNLIQAQYGQASFSNLQTFLQGAISTYTFASSATPMSWRSLEGAFFAEDAIKLTPSLEVRLGFRGEFTNGWNEAYGRASELFVYEWSDQHQSHRRQLRSQRQQCAVPAGSARGDCVVAVRLKENRDSRGGRPLLRADRQSQLPPGPEWPFNTVQASKKATVAEIEGTGALPTPLVIPSGVQPNLQTPTVISYDLKIEQQILPNTTAECRLHRLARLSRNSFDRRQRAEQCRHLPGVAVPGKLSFRGLFLLRQPGRLSPGRPRWPIPPCRTQRIGFRRA